MTTVIEAETFYPAQFQHYVTRNVTYVLGLVQQASPVLPDELRVQALHTLSYALPAPTAWAVTRELFMSLAPKMEQAGQREHWIPYLKEALRQSSARDDGAAAGECHLQLAILYRLLSQFDLAHEHLQAALDHFALVSSARDQARTLNELAWLEHLQHRYESASIHVQAALDLLPVGDEEQGMSYRVQGMIAIDEERWQDAEELHSKSLRIFESQGNQRKIAWGTQNLAYALRGQRKFAKAIEYYERVAALLREIADTHSLATVFFNLGITYYQYGEVDKAIDCYTRASTIFRVMNNKLFFARIHTDLGLAYLAQSRYAEAEDAFSASVQLFQELDDEAWRLNAVDGLAMTYLLQQNYAKAITILEKALIDLPNIIDMPNYSYLHQSLNEHLKEAKKGQGLSRLASERV